MATYYVTRSDSKGTGAELTPWGSLSYAITQTVTGDILKCTGSFDMGDSSIVFASQEDVTRVSGNNIELTDNTLWDAHVSNRPAHQEWGYGVDYPLDSSPYRGLGKDQPWGTINAALADTQEGDSILVRAGTYSTGTYTQDTVLARTITGFSVLGTPKADDPAVTGNTGSPDATVSDSVIVQIFIDS